MSSSLSAASTSATIVAKGRHGRRRQQDAADDGLAELVPNEEPPAVTPAAAPAVPVLYYTTGGGRASEQVAIVTNSVGAAYVVSPSGQQPADLDPKRRPVTAERLSRLRCLAILALLTAPPVGLLVLLAFLRCRRAFAAADAGDDSQRAESALWAGRTERLFVASMFCVLAELVIVLLAVEYHLRLSGSMPH